MSAPVLGIRLPARRLERALRSGASLLSRRRRLVLPGAMCLALVLAAIIGPFVTPYPADVGNATTLAAPSAAHWFGTDELGRDVFSRMLDGTRVSITIGLGSVLLSLVVGTAVGILAGLKARTWVESVLMRLMDLVLALPVLVVASVMAGITGGRGVSLGPIHLDNLVVVLLIIALVLVPIFARLSRASTLAEARQEYIAAAKACGLKSRQIILSELLPNVLDPLVVQAALSVGAAIAAEAALSYLGLGIQPPQASWGNILLEGQNQLLLGAWWLILFPVLAIAVSTFSFILLGDRLREELDPRSMQRAANRGEPRSAAAATPSAATVPVGAPAGAGASGA